MRRPCTYFEINEDDAIRCYKADDLLTGQAAIYEYCIVHGIPIKSQFNIMTIRIIPFCDMEGLQGDWIIKEKSAQS